MNYVDDILGDAKVNTKRSSCNMKRLRERYEDIQLEQQEIQKAFDVIKDMVIDEDDSHKHMLQQFDTVKHILLYTRNNKWLVMKYLAEHDDTNSLSQLISMLLGYQSQEAVDNNDEALEDKLHIESCIWLRIVLGAKYPSVKAN